MLYFWFQIPQNKSHKRCQKNIALDNAKWISCFDVNFGDEKIADFLALFDISRRAVIINNHINLFIEKINLYMVSIFLKSRIANIFIDKNNFCIRWNALNTFAISKNALPWFLNIICFKSAENVSRIFLDFQHKLIKVHFCKISTQKQ